MLDIKRIKNTTGALYMIFGGWLVSPVFKK